MTVQSVVRPLPRLTFDVQIMPAGEGRAPYLITGRLDVGEKMGQVETYGLLEIKNLHLAVSEVARELLKHGVEKGWVRELSSRERGELA